jgi:hypothetical protein
MRAIFISFIFALVLGNYYQSYAQLQSNHNTTASPNRPAVVPCNPNILWVAHSNLSNLSVAKISEFTLINSNITFVGTLLNNCPGMDFAYASINFNTNNGNTFYSVDSYTFDTIHMYNGTNWIPLSPISYGTHFNIAGKGNILILDGWPYKNIAGGMKHFFKYSGNTIDSIYNTGNTHSNAIRSLTIDDDYNIWFFIGPDPFASPASYLCKIDTSGNLIKQYPLSQSSMFNTVPAGGMFLLNNTLYIYFGYGHPNYPNTLMPFNIIGDSIVMGNPIPFNYPDVYDIKSCNQGTLTSISEVPESMKELSVYPNPARDQFMLHLPYSTSPEATVQVFNLQGEIIYAQKAGEQSPINCSSWPRGFYFVSLLEKGKAWITKKVVVM